MGVVLMRLTRPLLVSAGVLALALSAPEAPAQTPAQVKLPLKDYLALVDRIETAERTASEAALRREPAVAEVVSSDTLVVWGETTAEVTTVIDAEVRGTPIGPVHLGLTGAVTESSITPAGAAALRQLESGFELVAPSPGRYTVKTRGIKPLRVEARGALLTLVPDDAPVAATTFDLPAELAWAVTPAAVVVGDEVSGGRRRLRLALQRHATSTMRVWREVKGEEEEKALARGVVVTIVQLRAEGARRHDVVLYEVSRGSLASFTLDLPEGLEVERVATDEGEVSVEGEGRRIEVQRAQRLSGAGHVVVTTAPVQVGRLSLAPVVPDVEVRARYLAWAPTVAAEAKPEPPDSWTRVDLGDLPEAIRAATDGIKISAAWLASPPVVNSTLALDVLPTAAERETVIRSRETTTLLTKEGTLLHRDHFGLARAGAALEVWLPSDATLWSASVNGLAVRAVQRNGATLVPLPIGAQEGATVDVVVVQERAITAGRSRLSLSPPRVTSPVLEQRWRLLLPEENTYRFVAGSFRPAPENPVYEAATAAPPVADLPAGNATIRGTVTHEGGGPLPGVTVTLTARRFRAARVAISDAQGAFAFAGIAAGDYALKAELSGFTTTETPRVSVGENRTAAVKAELAPARFAEQVTVSAERPSIDVNRTGISQSFRPDRISVDGASGDQGAYVVEREGGGRVTYQNEIANLKQGLVGGVKPVPVTIPESGKTLLLAGALPPAAVSVELEVKAKR
jgi:hypothetical protein